MKRTLTAIAVALCIVGCTETKIYYVTGDDGTEEGTDGTDGEDKDGLRPLVGTYIFSNDTLAVTVTVTDSLKPYPCYISVFTTDYPTLEQPYWRSPMISLVGDWPDLETDNYTFLPFNPMVYVGKILLSLTFDSPVLFLGTVTNSNYMATHTVDGKYVGDTPVFPDNMEFVFDPDLDLGEYDDEVKW